VSSIRKLKYSDSTAVHRRILASIWRLFCKWNSLAAVTALHAARQQAYSAKEAAASGQHSGSVSSPAVAVLTSSACLSPCDGSPQASSHSLSIAQLVASHRCRSFIIAQLTVVQVAISDCMNPLRYGPHWSVLGFQSDDPVTDLRCCEIPVAAARLQPFTRTACFTAPSPLQLFPVLRRVPHMQSQQLKASWFVVQGLRHARAAAAALVAILRRRAARVVRDQPMLARTARC
jgi:hypothetical protein